MHRVPCVHLHISIEIPSAPHPLHTRTTCTSASLPAYVLKALSWCTFVPTRPRADPGYLSFTLIFIRLSLWSLPGACTSLMPPPRSPHHTSVRCEPVMALPSHICCWALTRELKGPPDFWWWHFHLQAPVFCHTGVVVNGGPSWVRALLFQKREKWAFSKLAGETQAPPKSVSCARTPGFSQGEGWALQEFRWNVFHPKQPR